MNTSILKQAVHFALFGLSAPLCVSGGLPAGTVADIKATEKRKGRQAADPAVVTRAANLHGARGGKDRVPAGIDYTDALKALADEELKINVKVYELASTRVQIWLKVAAIGQAKPEVFAQYAGAFRLKFRQGMGLTIAQAAGKPKEWPEPIQNLWNAHGVKRVAETARVMTALEKNYTATIAVLNGKGTGVNEKLLALPATRAVAERKPKVEGGQTTGTTPEAATRADKAGIAEARGKADAAKAARIADMSPAQIVQAMSSDLSADEIVGSIFGLIASAKRHKEYNLAKATPFTVFVGECEAAYRKFEAADAVQVASIKKAVGM